MTLIHDYHGDPNSTYYVSKPLAPGWLAADPTWEVHTAEDSYQGTINITKATILSDNTVFVQLAADLGWDKLDDTARAMGITSPLDGNPAEVHRRPALRRDAAGDGRRLRDAGQRRQPRARRRSSARSCSPTAARGTSATPSPTRCSPTPRPTRAPASSSRSSPAAPGTSANYGCPVAGKTGTANNLENAWFVGYSPRMSTAVWVGYPQGNIPMSDGFGGALAAPIWNEYMHDASSGYCGNWRPPTAPFQGTAVLRRVRGDRQARHGAPSDPEHPDRAPPRRPSGGSGVGTGTSTSSGSSARRRRRPPRRRHPPARRRRGRERRRRRRRRRQRQWRRRGRRPRPEALIALRPVRGW